MRSYRADKRRVDTFEPEIKRILGEVFIGTADAERDRKQATDLLVLNVRPVTIACRVRKFDYFENFGHEFTVRHERGNGCKSEFSKIVDGWCDYGFYAFADETDEELLAWTLYDLKVFRATLIRYPTLIKTHCIWNEDGSSSFLPFAWADFPPELVVASERPPREADVAAWYEQEYGRLGQ